MAADAGLDTEAAAKASKEYLHSWREIVEQVGIFKDVLSIALLGPMKELAGVTKLVIADWLKITQDKDPSSFMGRIWDGIKAGMGVKLNGVRLTPEAAARVGRAEGGSVPTAIGAAPGSSTGGDKQAHMAEIERRYSLPPGLLDSMWLQESGRGKNKIGPMTRFGQAKGDFQFTDGTAKSRRVGDVMDFYQSAEAAGSFMRDNLQRSGGDLKAALAGYNWGPGNIERYKLGKGVPGETQKYADQITGRLNLKTEIHVHGVQSPEETARLVVEAQQGALAEVIRNIPGVVQ